jgi:maltooligosyltrehalose trehalohydrolase
MGEEFADTAPFLYFTSHIDPALARAVTEGRRKEYAEFALANDEFFDPQASATFEKSRITWDLLHDPLHQDILRFHRKLIALRKEWPCLANCRKDLTRVEIDDESQMLRMERGDPGGSRAVLMCNFAPGPQPMASPNGAPWHLALRSLPADEGVIAGNSAVLWLSSE